MLANARVAHAALLTHSYASTTVTIAQTRMCARPTVNEMDELHCTVGKFHFATLWVGCEECSQ